MSVVLQLSKIVFSSSLKLNSADSSSDFKTFNSRVCHVTVKLKSPEIKICKVPCACIDSVSSVK